MLFLPLYVKIFGKNAVIWEIGWYWCPDFNESIRGTSFKRKKTYIKERRNLDLLPLGHRHSTLCNYPFQIFWFLPTRYFKLFIYNTWQVRIQLEVYYKHSFKYNICWLQYQLTDSRSTTNSDFFEITKIEESTKDSLRRDLSSYWR